MATYEYNVQAGTTDAEVAVDPNPPGLSNILLWVDTDAPLTSTVPAHTHSTIDLTAGTMSTPLILGAGDKVITNMQAASYRSTAGSETGYILIQLPATGYSMSRYTIKGYDYNYTGAWEIVIGGYNYLDGSGFWVNTSAQATGFLPGGQRLNVRFLHNGVTGSGARFALAIGESSTIWTYPQLSLLVDAGFTGRSIATGAFTMSITTSLAGWNTVSTKVAGPLGRFEDAPRFHYAESKASAGAATAISYTAASITVGEGNWLVQAQFYAKQVTVLDACWCGVGQTGVGLRANSAGSATALDVNQHANLISQNHLVQVGYGATATLWPYAWVNGASAIIGPGSVNGPSGSISAHRLW